jgi:TonB-linked SusC/RagA family outer membrane protein
MKERTNDGLYLKQVAVLLFLFLSFQFIQAQVPESITVRGKIISSEDNKPLSGVSVLEKSTGKGTSTDTTGYYAISVGKNSTLVFEHVGFTPMEVSLSGKTSVDVTLQVDKQQLSDVILVGYGNQKKRNITGSISTLTAKDLIPGPASSFDQMLQGKVAGAQITQTSGAPGGNVNIVIRGISSITGGNSPLYVIDGFAIGTGGGGSDLSSFSSSSYSAGGIAGSSGTNRVNPLSTINPADIESIQILKDASATAIYGSRGANGVVIITTKRGKQGKATISFEQSTGLQKVRKTLDVLNPRQYAEFVANGRDNAWVFAGGKASDPNPLRSPNTQVKPAFRNPDSLPLPGTDWQDLIFQSAVVQNYQLSANGGGKDVTYFLSGGYFNQDGIIIGSNFKKFNLRSNIDARISPKLKAGISFSGSYSWGDFARAEGDLQFRGLIINAVARDPSIPVYDENGEYYSEFSNPQGIPAEHPLLIADEFSDKRKNTNAFVNNYIEYEFMKGLALKSSIGVNYNAGITNLWKSSKIGLATTRTGPATAGVTEVEAINWLNENTLTYKRTLGDDHDLDVVVGFTAQKNSETVLQVGASDFPTDDIPLITAGIVSAGTNFTSEWSMLSWLGRVNYTFRNKYLLSATVRRDGSSRFGENNRWGTFPSFSLGYRISDEPFMQKLGFINDLKLRGSWGISGNNLISNYASQGLLGVSRTVSNGQVISGIVPNSLSNTNLTWEQSVQTDFGIDLSLFNSRISITADIYSIHKKDLLLNVTLPAASGYGSSVQNIGEIENKGFEFTLTTENIRTQKFQWQTNFNISTNSNKVVALNSGAVRIANSDYQVTQVGSPISSFYMLKVIGIFQSTDEISKSPVQHPRVVPGDLKFEDVNKDGKITQDDKTLVGSPWPDFTWGFDNKFTYKNFTLGISINGTQGNTILFSGASVVLNDAGVQNQLVMADDRWKSPQDPGAGVVQRAIRNDYAFGIGYSSRYLFDGSFIKLRNINLAYNLPSTLVRKWKMQSVSFYLDAANVHVWTDYPSFDPEGNTSGDNLARSGLDFFSYPNPRTVSLGVRLSF